jgi:tetratricopeptide (TPR) repeat protein
MPPELLREQEVRLALEALEAGRLPEAIARFRAVHQKFPGYAEPLLTLGKMHLSRGELQDAVTAARKAARVAPESAIPLLLLGRALDARGDRDDAEKAYLRAEELAPTDPRPVFHLGRIAAARKQTEVAISRFRRSLEMDPAFAPATSSLVDQLRDSGSHDEAARIIAEALDRAPGDASLRLKLADIHLMQGNWEAAVREFRRSAETVVDDPMIHYFSSVALEQLGRNEEAIEALETALRQDPQLHHAWYSLARLLGKAGKAAQADAALREFEKARALQDSILKLRGHLDRHPRDLEALLALGEVLLDRGKPDEGLEILRRALALDPGNPRAQELLPRAEAESLKIRAGGKGTENPKE